MKQKHPKPPKRKKTKAEKRQAFVARLLRKPPEVQVNTLRQMFPDALPAHVCQAVDPQVLAAWTPRQRKPRQCAPAPQLPFVDAPDMGWQMSEGEFQQLSQDIVDAMEVAFADRENPWSVRRDRVILDLLTRWLDGGQIFVVEVEDTGYDRSTRAQGTGVEATLGKLDTLGQWLRMPTGETRATFISGMGMEARTWIEEAREQLEEHMDAFADHHARHEAGLDLGEEGLDCDSLTEIRIAADQVEGCGIGEPGFEDAGGELQWESEGCGYLGRLAEQTVEAFLRDVAMGLLADYRARDPIFEAVWLERNTATVAANAQPSRL